MRTLRIVWMVAMGLAGGCMNPCEDLAERRCEQVGPETESCSSIREEASGASLTMRRGAVGP